MNDDYISFETHEDVEASLELVVYALQNLGASNAHYKSAILNAHLALQGLCVCALTHSDGSGPLRDKSEKALRAYHEQDSRRASTEGRDWLVTEIPPPNEQLASIGDLLKRLPKLLYSEVERGADRKDPRKALGGLVELRTNFSHFTDMTRCIEPRSIHQTLVGSLVFMRRIAVSPSLFANRSRLDETRTVALIDEAIALLETLRPLKTSP